MTTIEVDQNTAQILQTLRAKAEAEGRTLDELLRPLAENGGVGERPLYDTLSPAGLADAFLRWAESHDKNGPALTLDDVSRDSIYEGR